MPLILVALGACSQSRVVPVPSLPPAQKALITNSVQMGHMPGPGEAPTPAAGGAELTHEEFCKRGILSGLGEGIHDFLEVPEDPAKPDGRKIKIFYYGEIGSPTQTPVLFLNGGPGASSWSSYKVIRDAKSGGAKKWRQLPFVFIDQRGNGCSDPYPQGQDNETLDRLRLYGTRGIVADSEAVRKKLIGDRKWKVFGQSYGAFAVHRYMQAAGDGVASAHAHANALNQDPMERLVLRIVAQNRVTQAYLDSYPDDRAVLQILNRELLLDRCFKDSETNERACGIDVLSPLTSFLGFNNYWAKIHLWINLMVRDGHVRDEGVSDFLARYYFGGTDFTWNRTSTAMRVIGYTDRNVAAQSTENCVKVAEIARSRGEDPRQWLLHECQAQLQEAGARTNDIERTPASTALDAAILALPRDVLTVDLFKQALLAHPKTPFYLYSGSKDSFVPKESFAEEVAEIKDLVKYKNFSGTGHDGFLSEPQVWEDLAWDIGPETKEER